jgi:replicative DNA helicase
MEQNTLEVTEQPEVFSFTSIRELVNETLKTEIGQTPSLLGLSTGFRALDETIGGFQKGKLTTIAVKPGMGKTAFLLSVANNMAVRNNYAVAIFSAERSSRKMTSRLIESETGMSVDKLQNGKLKASEKDHMHSLVNGIAKARIFLDDTPGLSAPELMQKCRQLKLRHQVDLIIIDYLELLAGNNLENNSRTDQLIGIVQLIRQIARELDIPVLLFSQLPGMFPGFGSVPRPALNDIPEFLGELSDVVLFLHRSDLDPKQGKVPGKARVEMIVAKHQDPGKQGIVPLAFIESLSKFTDLS